LTLKFFDPHSRDYHRAFNPYELGCACTAQNTFAQCPSSFDTLLAIFSIANNALFNCGDSQNMKVALSA
jgi:Protein of unknown function (DUF1161)